MASSASELATSACEALAAGAYDRALGMAEASLEAEDLADSHRLLGTLYYLDDRFEEAQHHWEVAFRELRHEGRLREAARTAIDLAGLHAHAMGHEAAGRGWAERARLLLERAGPCVEWGYLELAYLACDRVDIDALLVSTDEALTIALEFGDADLEAQAMADGGLALVTRGQSTEGFARLDGALAAISAGEVSAAAAGLCFCSMLTACDRVGDVRRAEEWTSLISDVLAGSEEKPRALHTHCRVAYGSVLSASGRWTEAEALMTEALGPAGSPNLAHRVLTITHLANLRVAQGRIDEAADLLAPFEDRVTTCGPLARVHLGQGEPDLAAAVLRRGLQELLGDVLRAGPLLGLLVEVELRRGSLDAAREAADELSALVASIDAEVLRADAALAEGRVRVAEGDVPGAIDSFGAAKSYLAGNQRPLQLGLVCLELAEVMRTASDEPAAIAEARAALACFERLGATSARDRTSALLRTMGDTARTRTPDVGELADGLTRREKEVLDLVREGLANAEIAERLFISPKTAEHHVGRILTKLGVRNRAEAAALAVRMASLTEK